MSNKLSPAGDQAGRGSQTGAFSGNRLTVIGGPMMILAVVVLLWTYPLVAHDHELTDLGKIPGYTRASFALYLGCLLVLFTGYGITAWGALRGVRLPLIAAITALLFGMFLFIYPATAVDVFLYAVRSRIWTEYGENPSSVIPLYILESDPYSQYMTNQWAGTLSPYGPLWNWIAAPGSMLSDSTILPGILYYKIVASMAAIAGAVLLYVTVSHDTPAFAMPAALLWLWNPLLLWEGIANGHNDVVAILPLIAALWAWKSERDRLVLPLLVLSVLIKYTAIPLLPLAGIAVLRRSMKRGVTWRTLVPSAALSAGLAIVSLAPFFDLRALIDAFDRQRGVYVTSIPGAILRTSIRYGWDIDKDTIGRATLLVVAIAILIACWRVWKEPESLITACFGVMFVLLFLGTPNLRPWYVVWLLPIALATGRRFCWLPAIVWSATALVSYAWYVWIRDWWHISPLRLEVLGLLLTLGPVLIALAWFWPARDTPHTEKGTGELPVP